VAVEVVVHSKTVYVLSDKSKPKAIWGRKTTGPSMDSRVAEGRACAMLICVHAHLRLVDGFFYNENN